MVSCCFLRLRWSIFFWNQWYRHCWWWSHGIVWCHLIIYSGSGSESMWLHPKETWRRQHLHFENESWHWRYNFTFKLHPLQQLFYFWRKYLQTNSRMCHGKSRSVSPVVGNIYMESIEETNTLQLTYTAEVSSIMLTQSGFELAPLRYRTAGYYETKLHI